jgi:predicted  nucleic acid-binding Zn-ribbon protein
VANAWREVDSLQGKITSKESTINEMKSAGLQLRERYAASKDKIRDLRAESSNLNQSLTETKGRLSELEAFATGFSEVDEEHL